jgi:hypothetical protein
MSNLDKAKEALEAAQELQDDRLQGLAHVDNHVSDIERN